MGVELITQPQSDTSDRLDELALGLVGKTGSGKSSLGNALLSRDTFKTSSGFDSETVNCDSGCRQVNGRSITIVDTPGTMDTVDVKAALAELRNAIVACPHGFHAFLVVLQIGRFTDEEYEGVQSLKMIFGDEMMKYAIIVFTHADKVKNDEKKFNDQMQRARGKMAKLDELMKQCGERVVMIDNSDKRDQSVHDQQVQRLIQIVDELLKQNGKKYTNELFKQVQQELEEKKKMEEENERKRLEAEKTMETKLAEAKNEMEKEMIKMQTGMQMMQLKLDHEREMRETNERNAEKMQKEMESRLASQKSGGCSVM